MIKSETYVVGKKGRGGPRRHLEHVPGQMIMRIRDRAVQPHLAASGLKLTAAEARRLPASIAEPLDYLRANAGLRAVRPVFSLRRRALQRASVSPADRARLALLSSVSDAESEDLRGIAVVSLDEKRLTPRLLKLVNASKAVEFVEPMPARWLAAAQVDPLQNIQWGLRAIQWFEARLPEARHIIVGVLDTGIDEDHPDLDAIDIEYRHDTLSPQDLLGHGTHVSGIIAAAANNGVGISGLARCKLRVWKIFPDAPTAGEFYVDGERYFRALDAVIGADVKVLNLSLGGTASSRTEAILFRRLGERGIVVCAAMGNEYAEGNLVEYPAAYDGVLAVGAIAETRRRARFSNTGRHIALVAPGANIISTLPTKGSKFLDETDYGSWSGTSMATPHVTAAAALVAARHPEMSAAEITRHLRSTATRLPDMRDRAWTRAYGSGLLNLRRALM